MILKNEPATDGTIPPDPFDGDVYLLRYAGARGNVISRLFINPGMAKAYLRQVREQGGTPTLHRTAASWGDCA